MPNGWVAQLERRILFRITRWVALAVCLLLFLALAGAGLMLAGTFASGVDRPDPSVLHRPASNNAPDGHGSADPSASPDGSVSVLQGLRMPAIMQEQFGSGTNRDILAGWLEDIERSERQDFLDALGKAGATAQAAGQEIHDGINRYHSSFQDYQIERKLAAEKASADRLRLIATIGSALALIALFSLVLVLMAIERNTRNPEAQEA